MYCIKASVVLFAIVSLVNCKPNEVIMQKEITFEDAGFPILPQPVRHPDSGPRIRPAGFEPDAGPIDPDQNFLVKEPFSKCEKHIVTASRANKTHPISMLESKKMAFFPLNEAKSVITIVILVNKDVYKNKIVGRGITTEQCNTDMTECKVTDVNTAKRSELTFSQNWNYVSNEIKDNMIEITVNDRVTQRIPCDYTKEEMKNAEWYFQAEDFSYQPAETVTESSNRQAPWSYIAQYPCSEFRKETGGPLGTPVPRVETEDPTLIKEEGGVDVSLIVGIAIGAVLLVLVITIITVVLVRIVKKRRTHYISGGEEDPINSTHAKGVK